MRLKRITYDELNSKQKEIHNFQKVAALLADYGFNCIKLDDDWLGADFLAYHKDGTTTLKVQLKARAGISKKYVGKDLYLAFPIDGRWYLLLHDELVSLAAETTSWLQSSSWNEHGEYSAAQPSRRMLARLSNRAVGGSSSIVAADTRPPRKAAKEAGTKRKMKSSGARIRELIIQGKLDIPGLLEVIHREYPDSKASSGDVSWNRWQLKTYPEKYDPKTGDTIRARRVT